MKTPENITKLNFNDLAFFLGVTTTEAKYKILNSYNLTQKEYEKYFKDNKTKSIKINLNDKVDKSVFESKIKSCSHLEGLNNIDFHIKTFNKGVSLTKLMEYSQNSSFSKALKFTGKHTILNKILNNDQLKVCQKNWLFKNTYNVNRWSKKTIDFIENNEWSFDFLSSKMDFDKLFKKQKEYQKGLAVK